MVVYFKFLITNPDGGPRSLGGSSAAKRLKNLGRRVVGSIRDPRGRMVAIRILVWYIIHRYVIHAIWYMVNHEDPIKLCLLGWR